MEYIVHHRYKGLAADLTRVNLPYGTRVQTYENFIMSPDGHPICYTTSEVAKRHFAKNDDGRGLERGALTYAIAYSTRFTTSGFRFSDIEARLLEMKWRHWLRTDLDVIIFNQDFFDADPDDLQQLANMLNIRVKI